MVPKKINEPNTRTKSTNTHVETAKFTTISYEIVRKLLIACVV